MRPQRILVTGGAGFIGSNLIRYLLANPDFDGKVVNADLLTYAGNLENLADVDARHSGTRYFFERVDIRDFKAVTALFERHRIDTVVHCAAETHVDRSILGPEAFLTTNVMGTFCLLEAARAAWGKEQKGRFHHVSTDEVYGSLGETGRFSESSPYDPRSPYSASKAASDHLVMSYYHTYGLPVTLSNSSNNYGPYQFPEKLIPYMIASMREGKPLSIYGDGKNVRDWIYVEDHVRAIWQVLIDGREGEKYNIGGESEWENKKLVEVLCETVAAAEDLPRDHYKKLMTFVKDRPGHDRRYAIDCSKMQAELGWKRRVPFDEGLKMTVAWYKANSAWVDRVTSGEYRNWVEKNYGQR
jgi:dTDP-glucose 4,6-dehydratase